MLKIKDEDSLLMSIPEVRTLLNMGEKTNRVYTYIKNNNIQYIRVGNRWDVSRESLYNHINKELEKSVKVNDNE